MERTLREWQVAYKNGAFRRPDRKTMIDAGWYDWFCKDESLSSRLDKMAKIIIQINNTDKLNLDSHYVWFKNNCPVSFPTYDDFRFADIATGETEFVVEMLSDFTKKRHGANYAVYWSKCGWEAPVFKCNKSSDLVKWFNDIEVKNK